MRIEGGRWRAVGPAKVDGVALDGGDIGNGVTLELGGYRVRLAPAPAGAEPAPVQRTESLARELMRNLMGGAGAPSLDIGAAGSRVQSASSAAGVQARDRSWGRGELDHRRQGFSRAHAEIRRGWDGTRIVDLDSKNGTKVDGTASPRPRCTMAPRSGSATSCSTSTIPPIVSSPAHRAREGRSPGRAAQLAAVLRRARDGAPRARRAGVGARPPKSSTRSVERTHVFLDVPARPGIFCLMSRSPPSSSRRIPRGGRRNAAPGQIESGHACESTSRRPEFRCRPPRSDPHRGPLGRRAVVIHVFHRSPTHDPASHIVPVPIVAASSMMGRGPGRPGARSRSCLVSFRTGRRIDPPFDRFRHPRFARGPPAAPSRPRRTRQLLDDGANPPTFADSASHDPGETDTADITTNKQIRTRSHG